MVTVKLTYPDGTEFESGGFADLASAQKWVTDQQKQPGWRQGTTIEYDAAPTKDPTIP